MQMAMVRIAVLALAAAGVGCNPCLYTLEHNGWPPPAASADRFAGLYRDKPTIDGPEGQPTCCGSLSLYQALTGDEGCPSDVKGSFLTRLAPSEGGRFRVTLLDGAAELQSAEVKAAFRGGFLDFGSRTRGELCLLCLDLDTTSVAAGISEKGDLVLWHRAANVLLLLGLPVETGGRPPASAVYRRQAPATEGGEA
jgi:hypothetical protein